MLERFPQLRGEMHDLFDQLKQDPDTRSDMEALDKRIRDTWAEVEATIAVGQGEHFEAAAANSESNEDHSMANKHHSINYIELPAADLAAAKEFYAAVFGWTFTDWGPEYVSFDGAGIDGGFRGDGSVTSQPLGVLAVLILTTSKPLEIRLSPLEAKSWNRSFPFRAVADSTSVIQAATNWQSGRNEVRPACRAGR